MYPTNPFDASDTEGRLIRVVFDGTSANRPFISDLVEETGKKVNILSANTKSVGGISYGQMVLELPKEAKDQEIVIDFFQSNGLTVTEVEQA